MSMQMHATQHTVSSSLSLSLWDLGQLCLIWFTASSLRHHRYVLISSVMCCVCSVRWNKTHWYYTGPRWWHVISLWSRTSHAGKSYCFIQNSLRTSSERAASTYRVYYKINSRIRELIDVMLLLSLFTIHSCLSCQVLSPCVVSTESADWLTSI